MRKERLGLIRGIALGRKAEAVKPLVWAAKSLKRIRRHQQSPLNIDPCVADQIANIVAHRWHVGHLAHALKIGHFGAEYLGVKGHRRFGSARERQIGLDFHVSLLDRNKCDRLADSLQAA